MGFAASGASSPTPPPPSPVGPYGGGGGGFYPLRTKQRKKVKELSTLLDESLPKIYAELTGEKTSAAAVARTIAEPFQRESGIDWIALEANARAAGRLLALVAQQRSEAKKRAELEALQRSDEDWFLMN